MLSAAVFLRSTEKTIEKTSAEVLAEYLENSRESEIGYILTDSDEKLIIKALRYMAKGEAEK